jgi:hypothetical protein
LTIAFKESRFPPARSLWYCASAVRRVTSVQYDEVSVVLSRYPAWTKKGLPRYRKCAPFEVSTLSWRTADCSMYKGSYRSANSSKLYGCSGRKNNRASYSNPVPVSQPVAAPSIGR